ncbi:MAG: 30S ribosomal protein S6 [Rickettsiaceae bacterium]|nr:30S ribosomal protein S6 [Rickettsiaceae bacterium]
MAFYEYILIMRQDLSSTDIDKVIVDFIKIIEDFKGKVIKKEYWDLRSLAYEINNNKKGHYYFIGIEANNDLLAELNRKIKLSESVIRSAVIKAKEISKEPSPILKEKEEDKGKTIDVTLNNNAA